MIQTSSIINEREVSLEIGRIASQSNGVVVRSGNTVLLCTVVVDKEVSNFDFVPLSVNYLEKFSAINKLPGGYRKREVGATDREILVSRVIDRALRAIIDPFTRYEIQVTIQVLSYDGASCDVLGILGASVALNLSGIVEKQVAAARIIDDSINIAKRELDIECDFFQAIVENDNKEEKIVMLEYQGKEEDTNLIKTLFNMPIKKSIDSLLIMQKKAADIAREFLKLQKQLLEQYDSVKKSESSHKSKKSQNLSMFDEFDIEFHECNASEFKKNKEKIYKQYAHFESQIAPKYVETFKLDESAGYSIRKAIKKKAFENVTASEKIYAQLAFEFYVKNAFVQNLLKNKLRLDGRKFDEIRELDMSVKPLPNLNGSAFFQRGVTQALVSVTLGSPLDQQNMETLQGVYKEKFLLHYNFPPYAVGEVGKLNLSRREVGHGELARKAFLSVLPKINSTLRVVSDITSCNGSSSMATVCAASLAMFDAGVLETHVAGIAIGLIEHGKKNQIIADITAIEDGYGSMDLKIAGTKNSITAMQLDIKNDGITADIFEKSLTIGHKHIKKILMQMYKTIKKPNQLKQDAAKQIRVDKEKVRQIIGKQGITINGLQREFDVKIDVDKSGRVNVTGSKEEDVDNAIAKIKDITKKNF